MTERSIRPIARPKSPHLQVYRPTLTMTMSIAHRLTAAALYFGTVLFVWWLMAISAGHGAYALARLIHPTEARR
jgi:succinate dehydrogenase / fumarate reductase, cytochrome b subunit